MMRALLCSLSVLVLAACDDKGAGGGEDSGLGDTDEETGAPAADADGDGYAADDCDDADAAVNPGAAEVCDEVDNDCDGDTDEDAADAVTGYLDADGDGYGDDATALTACALPDGYAAAAGDCDDANGAVNPAAPADVCNGLDDDCDGEGDEDAVYTTIYPDDDGDGFGLDDGETAFCGDIPGGYVQQGGDCDDADAEINPDASESCSDGVDTDCDGVADGDCTGCADFSVIAYYDSFGTAPLTTAATGLGMTILASTSEATFNTDFASGTWDVVIVDVPGTSVPAGVQSGMSAQIAAGRQVIFSYWSLNSSPTLQSLVGVTVARSIDPPLPLYPSASGLWTNNESLPTPIANYSDDAGDNGDVIVPVDPATSEILAYYDSAGAEASILTTFSGQVLVNGFLPWDFQSTDDDADGTSDMVELYTNELVWMTGCVP